MEALNTMNKTYGYLFTQMKIRMKSSTPSSKSSSLSSNQSTVEAWFLKTQMIGIASGKAPFPSGVPMREARLLTIGQTSKRMQDLEFLQKFGIQALHVQNRAFAPLPLYIEIERTTIFCAYFGLGTLSYPLP